MFHVVQRRDLALLLSGQLISRVGDWILWIALPFYVYAQTDSGMAAGAMYIVTNIPPVAFGSLAGVLVDRWPHKATLIITDLLRAGLILLIFTVQLPDTLWLLYLLAFCESLVSQFFNPAKSALLPQLVEDEALAVANTAMAVSGDIAMLTGPALSGLLYGSLGLPGIILIDAASFLFSAAFIAGIRIPPTAVARSPIQIEQKPPSWHHLVAEWRSGLHLIIETPILRTLFVISGITMIGNGIILVMWIVFMHEVLGGGALEYGWVQVAVAAGGIWGGLLMPWALKRCRPRTMITACGLSTGLLLLATFQMRTIAPILGLQLVTGVVAIGFYTPLQTLLQAHGQRPYLGRIFGAYATANGLLILVGQAIGTGLGNRCGPQWLLNLAALLTVVSSLYGLQRLEQGMDWTKEKPSSETAKLTA